MKADINVTPLVDIVLVLLIIFIVITPAVESAVRLPAARHSVRPERSPEGGVPTLILAARRDAAGAVAGPGLVRVEGREGKDARGDPIAFDLADPEGRRRLVAFLQGRAGGDRRVFVKADLDLPFRHVNDLLQACREAGYDEASVVTREEKGGGA